MRRWTGNGCIVLEDCEGLKFGILDCGFWIGGIAALYPLIK
jgi:hypothetical protein